VARPIPDRARSFRFIAMSLAGFGVVALMLGVWLFRSAGPFVGGALGVVGLADLVIAFLFFRRSSELS
jgi:hypothetical protein